MRPTVDDPTLIGKQLLQRAWNRDGLPEIGAGLTFLVCSGLIYAQQVLPHRSAASIAATLVFALGLPFAGWLGKSAVKRARNRWLVERSGYVRYLPHPRKPVRILTALAVMSAMVGLTAVAIGYSEKLLLPICGLLGALISGVVGWSTRLVRVLAGGVFMLLAGIGLGLSSIPVMLGMAVLFGFEGLFFLVTGGLVLYRFLNANEL